MLRKTFYFQSDLSYTKLFVRFSLGYFCSLCCLPTYGSKSHSCLSQCEISCKKVNVIRYKLTAHAPVHEAKTKHRNTTWHKRGF